MYHNVAPPALAALESFPHLQGHIERSLALQARRIAEREASYIPRPSLLAQLDRQIRDIPSGLIALEGPAGSGKTALLCHLAVTRMAPFWLPRDAAGAGLEALCAQLLGLQPDAVRLVPPVAGHDVKVLERLLVEVRAALPPEQKLVVLCDQAPDEGAVAIRQPFPIALPEGVVFVLACEPGARLPGTPQARVVMPQQGNRLSQQLLQLAMQLGCRPAEAAAVAARSMGSFLYVRLAAGLLQSGLLSQETLPGGLRALHQVWWDQLDQSQRHLAMLLATAGESLELPLLAELADIPLNGVQTILHSWRTLIEPIEGRFALYHESTRGFLEKCDSDHVAEAHARYVALAYSRSNGQPDKLRSEADGYLIRQLARHMALSGPGLQGADSTLLTSRTWIVAQERFTGSMRAAASDLAWELRMAARHSDPRRLLRSAALGGTLALLSRVLPPDALAAAFITALERGGAREGTFKRVREMLDQLPDGRDKAQALRRLGEVCYSMRMRTSAMRMLSEALDLEVPGLPRSWRDQREAVLVAFARAAIAMGMSDTALGITVRIGHAERRGLIETEAIRWLLTRDQRKRAEEVAYAIGHEGMHEWAMAEVAVGHARAGNRVRSEEVLETLKTETAIAWARGELACDAARQGHTHAIEQVDALYPQSLRDRALALVAQALAAGGNPSSAVATARRAEDREVRIRALIELAQLPGVDSRIALAYAAADIVAMTGEERVPLVAALAAAQAALGQLETGKHTAALLPEGEERDRAHSRIGLALARRGDEQAARAIVQSIADDDERDWALDELARLLAAKGDWATAFALTDQICDAPQRAHTEADLAIALARSGDPENAQSRAEQISVSDERVRALIAIASALAAAGQHAIALATLARMTDPDVRSKYQAAIAMALAAHGELVGAQGLARTAARPLDRARSLVAIARASAAADHDQALQMLGEAFRTTAALGRIETLMCLEWAAETLVVLGGSELLLIAASALDEIDGWWG